MKKKALSALMAVALTSFPVFASTAYGYSGTNASSNGNSSSQADMQQLGPQTSVLRPGADPNNPFDYPYLPPTVSPPIAGPRMNVPQPPAPLTPGTSTTTAFGAASGAGMTTASGTSTTTNGAASATMTPAVSSSAATNAAASDLQDTKEKDAIGTADLALGKPYVIGTQWPDQLFSHIETTNFPNTGQLTDGKTASLSFSDKGWVGLLRQYGRSIVVNLGTQQHVRRVSLDFLQNLGAGIEFPDSVTYYASNDGVSWYRLGTAWSSQGAGDFTPQTQSYAVDTDVNAQYIRAQFDDKVFAFTDEFAVYGSAESDSKAKSPEDEGHALTQIMGDNYLVDKKAPGLPGLPDSKQPTSPSGYLTANEEASGKINNMQLVYTGAYGSEGTWTQSDFLPMIAQENASGTPTGWLYDATLIGPYQSQLQTSTTGWSGWLNDLFAPNIELSAMNQAVGTLKQRLNDPSFEEKVVITIPGLTANPSDFGTVDASGQSLDLNPADVGPQVAAVNKVRAINWYIQQVESDWRQADFKNLQLTGFYWGPESLNVSDPYDPQIVRATSDLVHHAGGLFYWIPFYGATGINDWRSLGFDAVMVQPNVSFNWGINAAARLQSVAQMDQWYHMGIEIEAHWDVTSTNTNLAQVAQNKYFDYFTGGYVYGYEGSALKSYYLNSKTLVDAYQNPNPFYHQVYDNTVQFVNGKWDSPTFQ